MAPPMRLPRIFRLFVSLAAIGACGVVCPEARGEEPRRVTRVDPDAYPPPAARVPLILTGAAVTGAFYGGAVGASYLWPDARGAEHLRIPIVGPWMKLFQTGCSDTAPDCNRFLLAVGAVLAGLDGLGQAGGVGLLLEGIFLQTRPAAPAPPPGAWGPTLRLGADGGATPAPRASGSVSWYPVPIVGGADAVGLGVAGVF